jgi:hypothetical protein
MTENPEDSFSSDVQQLENLPAEELANWLRGRLNNRDAVLVLRDREPAAFLVDRIYPYLSPEAQVTLSQAAVRMIHEIGRLGTWEPEAAAALLRLADPLLVNPIHQASLDDVLLRIAENYPPASDVALAAVQALVTLGHKGSPRYWGTLMARDARYAPIALEAIVRSHFTSLQKWLSHFLPHEELEKGFVRMLPFLVEKHGGDVVMSLVIDIESQLSKETQRRISRYAAREQLTPLVPKPDLLQDRLLDLLRCVDTMLRREVSGRSVDVTSAAFARCARVYRAELRHRRDQQDPRNTSLDRHWEFYVGLLEHVISREEYHEIALRELTDGLEDVGGPVTAVRGHFEASRNGWLSSELRQQVVSALRLTPDLRSAREALKQRHRETGPSHTVLRDLERIAG